MSDTQQKTINFELVSPEAKLVSEPVAMAVIPGEEGQFGVMADHASQVATLKAGVVELHVSNDAEAEPRRIFIAGGFADVTGSQCTVLAEEALNVADLDKTELEKALADLEEDFTTAQEALDKARIQKRIDLTRAKLEEAVAA